MTDRTQPDSASTTGSTHIIRYALELGLLWIDGDGRDKVREALDALNTLEAQLEAVGAGGVQALSAAPAGFVPVAAFDRLHAHAESLAARLLAAEQQAAPKAAPGVGNSGFDHKTAADFLNGKTVSDEAVRKFVQASRWAHDERAALSATLLAMHGVLTSREAEIALLKKALMEAEAAPQQEPAFWTRQRFGEEREFCETPFTTDWTPLYTAPQQEAREPAVPPCISDAYERIDRFLRNNLGDEDYADFSHDLELLCTAQPTPQPAPDCHHRPPDEITGAL